MPYPENLLTCNDDFYIRVFEGIEGVSHDEVIDKFEKLVLAMCRQRDPLNIK